MDIIISALDKANPRFIEHIVGAHLGHARMAAGNIAVQKITHPSAIVGRARKVARRVHALGHGVAQDVIIFEGCFVDADDVCHARDAMEVYRKEVGADLLAIYIERA